jgi:hypothetical protein
MAEPTVAQIKKRIVDLCKTIPSIVTVLDAYPDDETPFISTQLPAIVVRVSWQANNVRESNDTYLMTMPYILEVDVALSASSTALVNEAALEATEPWIVTIPVFFGQRRRLELNDAGLAVECDMAQLVASSRSVRNSVTYARLFFRLAVTTRHTI